LSGLHRPNHLKNLTDPNLIRFRSGNSDIRVPAYPIYPACPMKPFYLFHRGEIFLAFI